jgi:alanine racemase
VDAGEGAAVNQDAGQYARPNVFEIDLDAVAGNVRQLRHLVGEARIFAAMKANGYGFGLLEVAPVLEQSGVDALCVADLSDAVRLRDGGISIPILLYGGNLVGEAFVTAVEARGLWATIVDGDVARALSQLARVPITVFVKVDVGLERLGVAIEEAASMVCEVARLPRLTLGGVYAHVHVPVRGDSDAYVRWQLERFHALLAELRDLGVVPPITMAASSPVVPVSGSCGLNGIDVGRLIYGSVRADRDSLGALPLQSAFRSLRSRLIQCRTLRRTEHLDEAPFPIRPGMRLGIVPMGFADGLDSLHCGYALVRGTRVPLMAHPSLEHTRLDLTGVPEATVGDEVLFVGAQGDAEITPEEVMSYLGFEQPARLAVAVRSSVRRVYRRTYA